MGGERRTRAGDAMRAVPRRRFLPVRQQPFAGVDAPLSIGHQVTNSQPTTVRNMLDLLAPEPGDRVLDVGAGSGWTSALLAWMVGPTGSVVAVERVPELVARLHSLGLERVEVHQAQRGVFGRPEQAPYERILVSAEPMQLPQGLIDQLDIGGVMVIPVGGTMLRVTRTDSKPEIEEHGGYRFVPLVDD